MQILFLPSSLKNSLLISLSKNISMSSKTTKIYPCALLSVLDTIEIRSFKFCDKITILFVILICNTNEIVKCIKTLMHLLCSPIKCVTYEVTVLYRTLYRKLINSNSIIEGERCRVRVLPDRSCTGNEKVKNWKKDFINPIVYKTVHLDHLQLFVVICSHVRSSMLPLRFAGIN